MAHNPFDRFRASSSDREKNEKTHENGTHQPASEHSENTDSPKRSDMPEGGLLSPSFNEWFIGK
jgi:heme-binding NEAT domain protein